MVRMRSFGSENVSKTKSTPLYSLEGDGPLAAITSCEVEDGVRTVVRAKMKDGKLAVSTKAGETTTTRTVELPRERLREWLDGEAWLGCWRMALRACTATAAVTTTWWRFRARAAASARRAGRRAWWTPRRGCAMR